jgi:hypothetical protein
MNHVSAICVIAIIIGCTSPRESSNDDVAAQPANYEENANVDEKPKAPRWPEKETGIWLQPDDPRLAGMNLTEFELIPMQRRPRLGYVPVECMGPTIRAELENKTEFEIANIRIRVRAFRKSDHQLLGDTITDTPGEYSSTLPGKTARRKFVLNSQGSFADQSAWPNHDIEVSIVSVQVCDTR